MSTPFLTVSPSPHIHSDASVQKLMYGVIIAMIPAMAVSFYVFGIGALFVTLLSVVSCVVVEFALSKYLLKKEPTIVDGSAVITGILLAFNVPSNLPWWAVIIGSIVAIGIGKSAFGGLGNNPFNPALVGRVFLLISFPVQMTSWPVPFVSRFQFLDATTGATPLGELKEGISAGSPVSDLMSEVPSYLYLLAGGMAGSVGEISALALIVGFLYMLWKKIVTWHTPVAMLASIVVFSGMLWMIDPTRFVDPVFHLLTGGIMLGALFMATDYVTSPMTHKGMLIYGAGIGILTIVIRTWGAYPEGVSFAILIMNGVVPLMNKYIKPKRFGIK
ncbi:MAG: RnfABCDGE type electron transport complex subunit D [Cyclobacteriaceae bacterium]|nr:RnfABCDGE type electron transport complex subunit D [Cyclobacteriaceae bacterium]